MRLSILNPHRLVNAIKWNHQINLIMKDQKNFQKDSLYHLYSMS